MSTNEKQNNATQEEVRILLGAIEIMRKEILATVADAHASIISSVNEQMRRYREGILTRYGLIPSKRVQSEQPIETIEDIEKQSIEKPVEYTPGEESTEENVEPIIETSPKIVDKVIEEPEQELENETITIEAEPEENKDMLPKNMTKRLTELKWYKTKDRDYLIHNVDTLETDIKLFWTNILTDKKESEILTFENYGYQIVVGKENILWLRRWTKEQLETSKQETT